MNEMKTWSFNGTQFEVVDEEARRRAVPEGGAEGQVLTAGSDGFAVWDDVAIPEEYATKEYVNEVLGVIENGSY